MKFHSLPVDSVHDLLYNIYKIGNKEKPRMTEEQIKKVEEKLENLRQISKKAYYNGNRSKIDLVKSKIEGINFMLNLLGYKITLEDNQTKIIEI